LASQVPSLAPVAQAVKRVVDASVAEAPRLLLDLLLLTQQVRFSLAPVGVEGLLTPVPASGPWGTPLPVSTVRSVREILGGYGPGRYERLSEAFEHQTVADLRLVEPMLRAMNHAQDVGDLVAEKGLPAFGARVLPDLQHALNIRQGRVADVRRLKAICKFDASAGREVCRRAVTEGNESLQIQALECLAEIAPPEAERAALEKLAQLAQHPRRELRSAALQALKSSTSDVALDHLHLALLGKDPAVRHAARVTLSQLPHPRTTERLLQALATVLAELEQVRASKRIKPAVKGKGKAKAAPTKTKALADAVDRTTYVLTVFGWRKDRQAVPAIRALLDHPMTEIRENAAEALTELGDPEGLEAAAALLDDPKLWRYGLEAAFRLLPRERYERLAPLCDTLSNPKKSQRQQGDHLLTLFEEEATGEGLPWLPRTRRTDWDPRWVQRLLPHLDGPNRSGVAIALEVVMGVAAVPRLLEVLAPSVKKNECGVVEALGRLQARAAIAPMIALMPIQKSYHYCVHDALRRIGDPAAIPLLQRLLEKTRDHYRRRAIEDVIEYLQTPRDDFQQAVRSAAGGSP
jgi:HEAT repeat protein